MQTTITLSDPVTRKQFNKSSVTLEVSEVIDFGNVTGYVTKEENDMIYMLVVKNGNYIFNPRIYYLDVEGNLKDDIGLITLLNEKGDDLADHIEATIEVEEDILKTVLWHKKSESISSSSNHRIAEYTSKGNESIADLCLINWMGDNKKGTIQVWYGQNIKSSDFEIKNSY